MSEDNNNTKKIEDYDVEEAEDIVRSLHGTRTRSRMVSDITGLSSEVRRRPGRRSVSDVSGMVLLARLDEELPADAEHARRRRQKSSADVVAKMHTTGQLSTIDLRLAEGVTSYGTRRERKESGLSDKEFIEKIEALEVYEEEFEFNEEGLSSEEAARRLEQYGPNELPEKVDPKWLVFIRQFWAPMPIMIW
jgi:H+-transporting ATPase